MSARVTPSVRYPWAVITVMTPIPTVYWYPTRKICEEKITEFIDYSRGAGGPNSRTRRDYAIARWCGKSK